MTRLMKGIGRLLVLIGLLLSLTALCLLVILPLFLTIVVGYSPWILTAYTPFLLIFAYMIGDDT